jgi:hypothetical protein
LFGALACSELWLVSYGDDPLRTTLCRLSFLLSQTASCGPIIVRESFYVARCKYDSCKIDKERGKVDAVVRDNLPRKRLICRLAPALVAAPIIAPEAV